MANYMGNYQNDFGIITQLALLPVYLQRINGGAEDRFPTTHAFDADYLPNVFLDSTRKPGKNSCDIANGTRTIRHVKIYLNQEHFLYVPVPWRGGTEEFKSFLDRLSDNSQIVMAILFGEHIDGFYTTVYATGEPPYEP
jgi:hypothetical protein